MNEYNNTSPRSDGIDMEMLRYKTIDYYADQLMYFIFSVNNLAKNTVQA